MSNILLEKFQTPYETAPFDDIKTEDFIPAFQQLVSESLSEIEAIAQNDQPATFQNVIEALAFSGEQLDRVSNIFFNLNSAETSDEIQKIAQQVSPLLSEYSSKISQNEALFQKIKHVYEQEFTTLQGEEKTLLEETYKGFVRNGANLNQNDKEELANINKELSAKSLKFGENVLASTNQFFKHIINEADLAGIPDPILAQYRAEAAERNLEGFVITLQYPSVLPALTYAKNRELRKELTLANGKKSFANDDFDNQQIIKDILKLKQQKAKLLGFETYADYVLEERMAKSPEKVRLFLDELLTKAKPFAEKELQELKTLAKKDGLDALESYDHAYYAEKLRKERFDLNDEELKPYFPLDKVQTAVFQLAEKLFDLTFKEMNHLQKYHADVRTYEVWEKDDFKAVLYVDYFPRKGKRAGAWMTSFRNEMIKNGENIRPHISVVCNFSKPHADLPSLLTFNEVTTLFHEFGHAIHGILANTIYPTLSGTSVKWDFVELPSQFLENFCYEPSFLKTFAQHYKNGDLLSDEKIEKLALSKNFMEGYQTLRQVGFAKLDMAYHRTTTPIEDIKAFEDLQTRETQLYPVNRETALSPSFSHIFQGGYSAGYYSYKWAEVLDADAFQYFKENGLFNPEIAQKYKKLLSAGGTQDPMILYKNFRGREPKIESLLTRAFG